MCATLRTRTKRIIGGRSILIHHGLPPTLTSKKLRAILQEYYREVGCDTPFTQVYKAHFH